MPRDVPRPHSSNRARRQSTELESSARATAKRLPATRRTDAIARKQLDASLIVMRIHIEEALADGDLKEVKECFRTLKRYLRSDTYVKRADRDLSADALDIIKAFVEDQRLDPRYREKQLRMMIAKIERKRSNRRV